MSVKIELKGKYIVVTDSNLQDSFDFPAKELRYREEGGNVTLLNVQNNNMHISYIWTDYIDLDDNAFASLDTLVGWLRRNTGAERPYDILLAIPSGNIDGVFAVNKFGANISVTADTSEDIWDGGGTYTYPTTADITHVHQLVDQADLRGADVEVQGLDINWDLVVQTQQLNATDTSTLVALDTPLLRVFRIKLNALFTATSNIHITNAGDTADYALITNGNNQTLMAQYTVPAGKTAYMTSLFFSNIDATNKTPTSVEIKMWVANISDGITFQLKHADAMATQGAGRQHKFAPYYKFSEKTDIKMTAEPADEDGHVHAGFDLIVIDN